MIMIKAVTRLLMLLCVISVLAGCSKPPEKTEDPAEIEKLRQKHKETMQRELSEG